MRAVGRALGLEPRSATRLIVAVFAIGLLANVCLPIPQAAAAGVTLVSANSATAGSTSVSLSFSPVPTAGDLLIVVCSVGASATIATPSGFTQAVNTKGTTSQAIFYKVAAGTEGSETCSGATSATPLAIQLYEYSGVVTSSPLDVQGSATGTSTTASSGSITTTNNADLLFAAAAVSQTSTTSISTSWNNSFTSQQNGTASNKVKSTTTYLGFGGTDNESVTATGTYSTTTVAGGGNWVGQIAAFKLNPGLLSADIVDGSGNSVSSPSVAMSAVTSSFACQTSTGTIGTSTQKIRVNNTTFDPNWTLSLAANTGSWSDGGGHSYAYNDSSGSPTGCARGQLSVNPATGTITPQTGCTSTGVTLGGSSAFASGVPSVNVANGTSAGLNCYWDIDGISLSQTIPPIQYGNNYSIGLTLTLVAN